jgi:hypothetical protein
MNSGSLFKFKLDQIRLTLGTRAQDHAVSFNCKTLQNTIRDKENLTSASFASSYCITAGLVGTTYDQVRLPVPG